MIVHAFSRHQIGNEIEGYDSRNRANKYLAERRRHQIFRGDHFCLSNEFS